MKIRLISLLMVLAALFCCDVANSAGKKSLFKGRIVAYRPVDRMQVASFVANKELLLFQTAGDKPELLKLIYVHQGYSDLKDDVVSGAQSISISVRRDRSCDQALGAFEKEAPSIPLQGSGSTVSTQPIVFASSVSRPSDSYKMKCYLLEHWAIQ